VKPFDGRLDAHASIANQEDTMRFKNREHAARLLAERLRAAYGNKRALVLGVPRGAMPMAKIIANELGGELDVVLVHKLGHPDQPEFAIGAVDESGNMILHDWAAEVPRRYIEAEKDRQLAVLRNRRRRYTPDRAPLSPAGRTVIVVDDGIATGSTMTAALRAVRAQGPSNLIGAVAVASPTAARAMKQECDAIVCLNEPAEFFAVGQYFDDFTQVTDEDVIALMTDAPTPIAPPSGERAA
jgi:predicted phosphoribosyltransferase